VRGAPRGRKKNSKEVKKLIDLGKEKGYLTYNELNEILPPNIVSPDQIDETIFGEMDIEVVDSNQRAAVRTQTDEAVEEEEDEEREVEPEADGEALGRIGDPVRMYLREMGTVSLLSREGEVVIANGIAWSMTTSKDSFPRDRTKLSGSSPSGRKAA